MLASSLVFLTPWAALVAVAAVVPAAALLYAARRVGQVRRLLGLGAPAERSLVARTLLVLAVVGLLVLAATQPVLRTTAALHARTDAQVFVVLDTSRSMLAAPAPGATTRLARAKSIAEQVAASLRGVPVGVATFTDRVLPDLFPTADSGAVDGVLRSVKIEDPPPRDVNTVATTFDALSSVATQGFFLGGVHKRAVLLITDGESRPFDPHALASALGHAGITLVIDRVGGGADRVWRANGTAEANYRPDPAGARAAVAQLAAATRESATGDPTSELQRALGSGPTHAVGQTAETKTLAPYVALLALLPLLALFVNPGWFRVFTSRNIAVDVVPRSGRAR